MSHILLLGAGFSRNYGGWLADELTADLMGRVSDDAELLRRLRHQNGFEAALEEVRAAYERLPTPAYADRLHRLEDAIGASFGEMNKVFEERGSLEFQQDDPNYWVETFLARFDMIFTLNQDLLLERLYKPENANGYSGRSWQGTDCVGMTYIPRGDEDEMWVPNAGDWAFSPTAGLQPIVKLHGSVNWFDIDQPSKVAQRVLIIGTNKAADILRIPVLSQYHKIFADELARPKTRLMVIGYSFGDRHINEAIVNAGTSLETFIVDPAGIKVLETLNDTKNRDQPVAVRITTPIEQITVIGLSRRWLSETFGKDRLAWRQLMRFFRAWC